MQLASLSDCDIPRQRTTGQAGSVQQTGWLWTPNAEAADAQSPQPEWSDSSADGRPGPHHLLCTGPCGDYRSPVPECYYSELEFGRRKTAIVASNLAGLGDPAQAIFGPSGLNTTTPSNSCFSHVSLRPCFCCADLHRCTRPNIIFKDDLKCLS